MLRKGQLSIVFEGQLLQGWRSKPHGQRKIQLPAGRFNASRYELMIRDLNLFHGDHCNMERTETEYEEAATNHVDKPEKGH